jgi:hypothetical protein
MSKSALGWTAVDRKLPVTVFGLFSTDDDTA